MSKDRCTQREYSGNVGIARLFHKDKYVGTERVRYPFPQNIYTAIFLRPESTFTPASENDVPTESTYAKRKYKLLTSTVCEGWVTSCDDGAGLTETTTYPTALYESEENE